MGKSDYSDHAPSPPRPLAPTPHPAFFKKKKNLSCLWSKSTISKYSIERRLNQHSRKAMDGMTCCSLQYLGLLILVLQHLTHKGFFFFSLCHAQKRWHPFVSLTVTERRQRRKRNRFCNPTALLLRSGEMFWHQNALVRVRETLWFRSKWLLWRAYGSLIVSLRK